MPCGAEQSRLGGVGDTADAFGFSSLAGPPARIRDSNRIGVWWLRIKQGRVRKHRVRG
jgi:hypothetical protein